MFSSLYISIVAGTLDTINIVPKSKRERAASGFGSNPNCRAQLLAQVSALCTKGSGGGDSISSTLPFSSLLEVENESGGGGSGTPIDDGKDVVVLLTNNFQRLGCKQVLHLINSIHMEDLDQLLSDLMEDPDLLHRYSRNIPFTRKQNVVNMTHKVKNIKETKTTITIDFTHTQQRFWRSAAGDVTAIVDAPFPPIIVATFPNTVLRNVLDEKRAEGLWSTTERDSLVHTFLSIINLSHNNWTNLETQVSLGLFNLVSTAKDEGYNAIDVVFFIEAETVDTYDEEDVARAMRELASVTNPAPRSSVEALPSQVLDDRISSDKFS